MEQYQITLSPTASGKGEYLQIISADGFAVNIVLIGEFTLNDTRTGQPATTEEKQ